MVKLGSSPVPLHPSSASSAEKAQQQMQEKLRSAAKMYEKHFLGEMVKAMRSTVSHGGLIQRNMAEKIFSEKLDGEYVESWGNQGGIGLADLIYQQVLERFGQQMGGRQPSSLRAPQGPVNFESGQMHALPKGKSSSQVLEFSMKRIQDQNGVVEVLSPWPGILLDSQFLDHGQVLSRVQHDNGLQSELLFQGSGGGLGKGSRLRGGQTIGLLGPEADSFFWRLKEGVDADQDRDSKIGRSDLLTGSYEQVRKSRD